MRKLIAPALVFVVLVLAFGDSAPVAQPSSRETGAPSGEDLERKAKSVLTAFQSLSPDSVYQVLAPWRRNEVDLHRARLHRQIARKELEWAQLDRLLHDKRGAMDPARKLSITSTQDFIGLSSAQIFGLFYGMYRIATDSELSSQLASEWFVTRRAVGEGGFDDWQRVRLGLYIAEQGGYVRFENLDGLELVVCAVADTGQWHVQEVFFQRGRSGATTTLDSMFDQIDKATIGPDEEVRRAKMAEGELLLGSLKGQARVAYAKAAVQPRKLTGAIGEKELGCGVVQSEMDGKYYKIRDTVRGSKGWGAMIAEPKEEGLKWQLILFKYTGGDGEFRQYDSETELLSDLQDLESEGWGKDDD